MGASIAAAADTRSDKSEDEIEWAAEMNSSPGSVEVWAAAAAEEMMANGAGDDDDDNDEKEVNDEEEKGNDDDFEADAWAEASSFVSQLRGVGVRSAGAIAERLARSEVGQCQCLHPSAFSPQPLALNP